jgi:hypothetical protein
MNPEKSTFNFETIEEAAQSASNQSKRNLLESTRLSRLPELPKRSKFQLPKFELPTKAAVCVNCKAKLDEYNQPLKSANVCRKCISVFTIVEAELDDADKRKRREMLERFVGGEK